MDVSKIFWRAQFVANGLALLRWQRHQKPWEPCIEERGSLPADDGLGGMPEPQCCGNLPDILLRLPRTASGITGQPDMPARDAETNSTAGFVPQKPLPSLKELEALRCALSGPRGPLRQP